MSTRFLPHLFLLIAGLSLVGCGSSASQRAEADSVVAYSTREAEAYFKLSDSTGTARDLTQKYLAQMIADSVFWKYYQRHTVRQLDSLRWDMVGEQNRAVRLGEKIRVLVNKLEGVHSDAESIAAKLKQGTLDDADQQLATQRQTVQQTSVQLATLRDSVQKNFRWIKATQANFTYHHDSAYKAVVEQYRQKYGNGPKK